MMQIPVSEFEHLHAEVRRLRDGWSDAEAQIAVLKMQVHDLKNDLTAMEMQIHDHDPQACRQCSGHPLNA